MTSMHVVSYKHPHLGQMTSQPLSGDEMEEFVGALWRQGAEVVKVEDVRPVATEYEIQYRYMTPNGPLREASRFKTWQAAESFIIGLENAGIEVRGVWFT